MLHSCASCFPIQFRNPIENGQTGISVWNLPFSSKNRSGLNFSGFLKFSGLCITAVSEPKTIRFLGIGFENTVSGQKHPKLFFV